MQRVRLYRHTSHAVLHPFINKRAPQRQEWKEGNGLPKCQQHDHVKLQVNSKYVAEDLVAVFDAGLEYAEADCLLDVQHRGDSRQYPVR